MRYQLAPIHCRPWLLNGLSVKLIESHYENNYGGALRRLNAITEKLESLDFENTPGCVINGLKREELIALNSTLLHELYFASLGGASAPVAKGHADPRPAGALAEALARDFSSFERWRSQFMAMGNALAGGSGWVLLVYVPRDRRLVNQYASEHSQAVAGGIPVLALDMYEHA
jgi:Fe-Mn family superoxide dismutase